MSDYDRNARVQWGASVGQAGAQQIDQGLRAYMLGVYNYMTLGLAVTGLVALATNMLAVSATPTAYKFGGQYLTNFGAAMYGSPLKWVVMLAPLAFIFIFSFRVDRMSAASARNMFLAFAAVMGLSLAWIFQVFTGVSIAQTFFVTAIAFAGLSLYGYTTKRNLSAFGSFLMMGLIGLVVASIVNIFLASSALAFAISVIGVLLFAGLTAWDTQAIKATYIEFAQSGDQEWLGKSAIMGALRLYLDFLNLFMFLLQFMGDRR